MSVKLRLTRRGRKNSPYYRVVVADSRSPRDGRVIERVGTYNPLLPKDRVERVTLKEERIRYWLSVGAKASDRVALFLGQAEIITMPAQHNNPNKAKPKAKAQERLQAKKDAEEAAAAAAAEATTSASADDADAAEAEA